MFRKKITDTFQNLNTHHLAMNLLCEVSGSDLEQTINKIKKYVQGRHLYFVDRIRNTVTFPPDLHPRTSSSTI